MKGRDTEDLERSDQAVGYHTEEEALKEESSQGEQA